MHALSKVVMIAARSQIKLSAGLSCMCDPVMVARRKIAWTLRQRVPRISEGNSSFTEIANCAIWNSGSGCMDEIKRAGPLTEAALLARKMPDCEDFVVSS